MCDVFTESIHRKLQALVSIMAAETCLKESYSSNQMEKYHVLHLASKTTCI